ncbi:glycoside hydrolase [Thermophagus sp. OGC60D27]|uniref:glycoside hydrolase n=1 Tax=Thermophagus sp. OGC60D27 TaxID=3458415 RepID=UPI0040380F34
MQRVLLMLVILAWPYLGVFGQVQNKVLLKIEPNQEFQVIHSFGASDAWRCQFIGQYWPESKKQQMTEWLFSKELDKKGNPLGIGLSMWRFYLGAGSLEQGDSSGIVNPWRRSECFLTADGTYDWSKHAGQQWFLKQAHQYGVENTMAFSISAPVNYTLNGKAFSPAGRTSLNIKDDRLDDYAHFLVKVCEYFEKKGLGFDYLSPFNEPQWSWSNPTQEGTPATNEDLFLFSYLLNHQMQQRGLKTQLALGEAAEYKFLYEKLDDYIGSSDQFKEFLYPHSPFYIGQFSHAAPLFSAHSYFTTWPVEKLIDVRKKVRESLDQINPNMEFWQSEFCILERNDDIKEGNGRDLGMGTALYVARVIHYDLTITNATSWQWWTAITQCDYKDGLIYIDNGNNGIPSQQHPDNEKLKYDGHFHDSKLLWALGNYSRFVRPGMVRVNVDIDDNRSIYEEATSLMVSAYKNNVSNEMVLVAVNYAEQEYELYIEEDGMFEKEVKTYVTSEDHDLAFFKSRLDHLVVQPKSVKTFVLKFK